MFRKFDVRRGRCVFAWEGAQLEGETTLRYRYLFYKCVSTPL